MQPAQRVCCRTRFWHHPRHRHRSSPNPQLAAAVTLLAGLIAKAATPNPIGTQVSRDE